MTALKPLRSLFAATTTALIVACSNSPDRGAEPKFASPLPPPQTYTVTIMAFNVENLFDNVDEPGKDDKAYLPIGAKQSAEHIASCKEITVASWRDECLNLDWSDDAVNLKLSALAGAIRQVNNGQGADIIVFEEVENAAILDRLRSEYLADSGYLPAILIEGQDSRGIDPAILSRLPLAEPATLNPLSFADFPDRAGDTRGILQATFELPDGAKLTGFAVHLPAPYQPTAMRVEQYKQLIALRKALPDDRYVFAAGDFNTTALDDRTNQLLDQYVRPYWTVSNDLCSGCKGTYFYSGDNSWSFLDMILWSPPRTGSPEWSIQAGSVHIANQYPAQVTAEGKPARFRLDKVGGVSDHWPLVMTIERRIGEKK